MLARLLKVLLLAALALMIGSLRSSIAPSTPENLEIGDPTPSDDIGKIHAIEASATGGVWVVGETFSKPTKGLVARWDGTEWKNEASLSVAAGDHTLYDIATLSPNDMWAVGEYAADPKTSRALIAHWDGTEWKVVTGIKIGPGNSGLRTISAAAPDDIWVGGWSFQEGRSPEAQSIILHWDGKAWRSFPPPANSQRYIDDMSAVSANDVWAVAANAILHWDGESWTEVHRVGGLKQSIMTPDFQSVAAISDKDVWVVGYSSYAGGCDHGQIRISHWDGHSWKDVPIPSVPYGCIGSPSLVDIHALAADDIWAVGTASARSIALHWDGTTWSLNACPDLGISDRESYAGLDSVTSAGGKVWVAGSRIITRHGLPTSSGVAFLPQPFIMHPYQGVCPTPTPWPTPPPEPTTFVPPTLPEVPKPVRTDIPQPVQTRVAPDVVETTMSAIRTATAFDARQTRPVPLPSPTPLVP